MTAGRVRRLLLSYATAGVSKIIAICVQILALPVVAHTLGAEKFGSLMVLGAMGAAFCMPARAIPPSLSIAIAHSRGSGDPQGIKSVIAAAARVSILLGILAVAVSLGLFALFGPAPFAGPSTGAGGADLAAMIAAFLLLIIATYCFAWVEGVRTGHEEHHLNNIFSLIGSMLALLGIALAWAFQPTVSAFFLAIYVVYPVVQLVNLLLARSLIAGGTPTPGAYRLIARRAFSWSVAQAGLVLNLQGTVWMAAHVTGLGIAGLVGAVIRFFQLLNNVFLALLTPILPTLRHSISSGDRSWSSSAPRVTTLAILAALTIFGGIVALFGSDLVQIWLGLDIEVDPIVFVGFGLLAIASMAPQLFYLVLMAMGSSKAASLNLLRGGVAGLIFGVAAMQILGLAGLIWGQGLGMLMVAGIPNIILVFRRLGAQGAPVRFPDNSEGDRISR